MQRISELTAMVAEHPRNVAVVDQSSSGADGPVASGPVRIREEESEGRASQNESASTVAPVPGQAPGGFLLQQTFNLPPFSLGSSTSLSQYFTRFEEHCSRTYAGNMDDALPLLHSLLVGEVKDIFAACGGTDVTYAKMKQRMLRWVSVQDNSLQQSARIRFDNAKRHHGEDPSLFALRLSSLFEDAYPSENMQTSELLRDRLIQNLPEAIGEQLKLDIKYNKAIHDKTLHWDHYLTIIQCKKHEVVPKTSVVLAAEGEHSRDKISGSSTPVSTKSSTRNTRGDTAADSPRERRRSRSRNRSPRREPGRSQSRNLSPRREPTTASRPSSRGRSGDRSRFSCDHCGRIGHTKRNCRQKHGLCYGCGNSDHFVRDCTSRSLRRDRGSSEERTVGTRSRNDRSPSRSSRRQLANVRQRRSSSAGSSRSPSPSERVQRSRRGPKPSENW